jgi:hypothetical protein
MSSGYPNQYGHGVNNGQYYPSMQQNIDQQFRANGLPTALAQAQVPYPQHQVIQGHQPNQYAGNMQRANGTRKFSSILFVRSS